ncbi:MAG: ribonuclease III [Lachnospiraceae bacterium]|nr:ribonuclease III [Lachnospiraceae bacterium]
MEEGVTFHELIENEFELPGRDLFSYPVLSLAFVGDNVYDLVVRTVLLSEGNCKVNLIHKAKSNLVKAETQAWIAEYLISQELLTDEEKDYYRRGKNAKTANHAKNADIADYHKATGLETVMGYLYVTNQEERAVKLCKLGIKAFRSEVE